MPLDDQDKAWIRRTLEEVVAVKAPPPKPLPRLTVAQFAALVDLHPDVVLRKIRTREISPRHVYGTRPKRISPAALEPFGVTAEQALAKLENNPGEQRRGQSTVMTTLDLPFLHATPAEAAEVRAPALAPAPCSAAWDDPHFQLAAEHFGYIDNAPLAVSDREVVALADFLRGKLQAPTWQRFEHVLRAHGLVDPCAFDDPEGFDNYRTHGAAHAAYRELLSPNAKPSERAPHGPRSPAEPAPRVH